MRYVLALFVSIAATLVGGCAGSSPSYTQAQMTAIETREVQADLGETFTAASSALFDAGYTIAMSDREGGLITGTRAKDNTAARMWVSPYIQDTKFAISIQMREVKPDLTMTRVKTSVNGEPVVDKEAIDQIWLLMERQVLMHAPLSGEGDAAAPAATAPVVE